MEDSQNKKLVSYLLGAGASALALPVVREIPYFLSLFKKFLENTIPEGTDECLPHGKILKSEIQKKLLTGIEWLHTNSKHLTIDTFAKQLYLQGGKENKEKEKTKNYKHLKVLLAMFFLFEQYCADIKYKTISAKDNPKPNDPKLKQDPRYDGLLASLLEKQDGKFILPVQVMTWNYDMQFELAYRRYLDEKLFKESIWLKHVNNITNSFFTHLNGNLNFYRDMNKNVNNENRLQPINQYVEASNNNLLNSVWTEV
ncbi:MAG: hypothetical protein QM528_06805 [Phycisphaerales bacterium]|nr:hypothetical protein [Phycisphaerales bacterium]